REARAAGAGRRALRGRSGVRRDERLRRQHVVAGREGVAGGLLVQQRRRAASGARDDPLQARSARQGRASAYPQRVGARAAATHDLGHRKLPAGGRLARDPQGGPLVHGRTRAGRGRRVRAVSMLSRVAAFVAACAIASSCAEATRDFSPAPTLTATTASPAWTIAWRATESLTASWYRQDSITQLGRGRWGTAELGGAGFQLRNDSGATVYGELAYLIGSR